MKNILLNETAVATFGQLFIPKSGHTVNRVEYTFDLFENVLILVSVQKRFDAFNFDFEHLPSTACCPATYLKLLDHGCG